jgi:hypothetical protein
VGGAHDPGTIAQCLIDGLTEANRNILGGVMIVDVQIPDCFDSYVKLTVFGEEGEHVIEEADPGIGLALTGSIDGE